MKLIEHWVNPLHKPTAEIIWHKGSYNWLRTRFKWCTWDHRVQLCFIKGLDIQIRHRLFWPLSFLLAFAIGFVGCCILEVM